MTNIEAKELYAAAKGDVSEEEWTEMLQGREDFDAFLRERAVEVGASVNEGGETPEQIIARLQGELESERAKGVEVGASVLELQTQVEAIRAEKKRSDLVIEIGASVFETVDTQGTKHLRRLAPASVELMAAVIEADEEVGRKLLAHAQENGGGLMTYQEGEGVDLRAAMSDGHEPTASEWLDKQPGTQRRKDKAKQLAGPNANIAEMMTAYQQANPVKA
jgi:hypothetical protein